MTDKGSNRDPAVSPNGRYIVFSSNREGKFNLYRMDINTGDLLRLTDGGSDWFPACSPDGWVFYTSFASGRATLWRVALDGGDPTPVSDETLWRAAVSPDGKLLACVRVNQDSAKWQVLVMPSKGGAALETFEIASDSVPFVRWTPDGASLTYAELDQGVSDVWRRSLNENEPRRVTNFAAREGSEAGAYDIISFDWSKTGELACARGDTSSDVVLIGDEKD